MDNTYKSIGEYNPNKKRKILIIFYDKSADIHSNENLNKIVKGRKLNKILVFITQSYSKVPKDVRLNTEYFFIKKIIK